MLAHLAGSKGLALVLLAPALVLSLSACGTKVTAGAGGSGAGGSDAGSGSDAGGSASAPCPETLAAACAVGEGPGEFGVSCAETWQLAITDTHYCGGGIGEQQADCGAYRARITINVDVAFTYYYDATTGSLVAVFGTGYDGQTSCVGGPTTFVAPTCAASQPLDPCSTDAGAEGG
jgi:hypothetical protein